MIKINYEICILCGTCVATCPVKALRIAPLKIEYLPKKCVDCGSCAKACPVRAIVSYTTPNK